MTHTATDTTKLSSLTTSKPRGVRSALGWLVLAGLAATASACSAHAQSTDALPGKPVTVYGFESTAHTSADAIAAGKADITAVATKVANENGEVVVYRFGGSPIDMSAPASVTLQPKGDNDMFRDNNRKNLLKQVTPQLASILDTVGTSTDADVFGSLNTFAATLHEHSAGTPTDGVERRLVVRSRFAHRTGWADLTSLELDGPKIAEVMTWIKDRHLMPDLFGVDVVFVGVGRGDDSGISASRAAQFTSLMQAWCAEAHAKTCSVTADMGAL